MTEKKQLISCFQDTLEKSYKWPLKKATLKATASNRVYPEGFVSEMARAESSDETERRYLADVIEDTTFSAARKYINSGKTAVLNFANPVTPGGGVVNGAMAQEECLCRSSNLYACLTADNVAADYYEYNRNLRTYFYSDRLIYTKDVTVFKTDDVIPRPMKRRKWFQVDVITCAAPYLGGRRYTNKAALKDLFKERIRNIFEAALDNGVKALILGAFGCGAFKNPPDIVVEAFYEAIYENRYDAEFSIVFAIKPETEPDKRVNYNTFYQVFRGKYALDPNSQLSKFARRRKMQISVLGDSISTLEGFNPKGYSLFYEGNTCKESGVMNMKDTWWGQVINSLCGELLVNNSWSSSRVTKAPGQKHLFPSGCSDERTGSLHIDSVMPDIILVYLGTNDWADGVSLGKFYDFYYMMTGKLKHNYPDAEILCFTLNETYMLSKPEFKFPSEFGGVHIEKYNEIIKRVACEQGCRLIELYEYDIPHDTLDGSHPTATGMKTIARLSYMDYFKLAGKFKQIYRKESEHVTRLGYQVLTNDFDPILWMSMMQWLIDEFLVEVTFYESRGNAHDEPWEYYYDVWVSPSHYDGWLAGKSGCGWYEEYVTWHETKSGIFEGEGYFGFERAYCTYKGAEFSANPEYDNSIEFVIAKDSGMDIDGFENEMKAWERISLRTRKEEENDYT